MDAWVATMNNAAMNMDVQISVQVPAFNSFGIFPEMGFYIPRNGSCGNSV